MRVHTKQILLTYAQIKVAYFYLMGEKMPDDMTFIKAGNTLFLRHGNAAILSVLEKTGYCQEKYTQGLYPKELY